MVNFVSSIAVDDVIDALAPVIKLFMNDAPVIRTQVNRVAMPPNPCATLTEIATVDIDTPYETYDPDADIALMHGPQRIDIQIDFYGLKASDQCQAVKTALRTQWAFTQFPANIKPLYTNDGAQIPLITGEQQYENRWTLTVSIQYNPIVTVPQEFADVATVSESEPIDVIY